MNQGGSIVKKRGRYYVVDRNLDKKQKWLGGFKKRAETQTTRIRVLGEVQTGEIPACLVINRTII